MLEEKIKNFIKNIKNKDESRRKLEWLELFVLLVERIKRCLAFVDKEIQINSIDITKHYDFKCYSKKGILILDNTSFDFDEKNCSGLISGARFFLLRNGNVLKIENFGSINKSQYSRIHEVKEIDLIDFVDEINSKEYIETIVVNIANSFENAVKENKNKLLNFKNHYDMLKNFKCIVIENLQNKKY